MDVFTSRKLCPRPRNNFIFSHVINDVIMSVFTVKLFLVCRYHFLAKILTRKLPKSTKFDRICENLWKQFFCFFIARFIRSLMFFHLWWIQVPKFFQMNFRPVRPFIAPSPLKENLQSFTIYFFFCSMQTQLQTCLTNGVYLGLVYSGNLVSFIVGIM